MIKYIKKFDEWNKQKKSIQNNKSVEDKNFFYHEREVWWSSVGVNVGVEMDGKNENFERPLLVLRKVNNKQFFGIPITSKDKKGNFYIDVSFGDTNTKGKACLSQVKVFSTKRLLRKIGKANQKDFSSIKNKFIDFFSRKYE